MDQKTNRNESVRCMRMSDLPDFGPNSILLLSVSQIESSTLNKPKHQRPYSTYILNDNYTNNNNSLNSNFYPSFTSKSVHNIDCPQIKSFDLNWDLNNNNNNDNNASNEVQFSNHSLNSPFQCLNSRNIDKIVKSDVKRLTNRFNNLNNNKRISISVKNHTENLTNNDKINGDKVIGDKTTVIVTGVNSTDKIVSNSEQFKCLPKFVTNQYKLRKSNLLSPSAKLCLEEARKIRRQNQRSKRNFFNVMDRSVDSIGSCSLDVDADSTDFSDTSGSLNLCTPLSGKDITREFTSRIYERCQIKQILPCQKSTVILDPASGKINTVLASPDNLTTTSATSPIKKPSYLNLACCVNGYSNLTTYDSKFRQNIQSKSREVSPIRPITRTLQYSKSDGNYLVVPVSVTVNGITDPNTMNNNSVISPEKRFYTPTSKKLENGKDVTDNVNLKYYTPPSKAVLFSNSNSTSPKQKIIVKEDTSIVTTNDGKSPKSFIQQRVERLYGPGALAQGFYSPKRTNSDVNSIRFSVRTPIHSKLQKTEYCKSDIECIDSTVNAENLMDEQALPVLRHLRPEFRAQLPILSPKRSINKISAEFDRLRTTCSNSNTDNVTATNGNVNNSTSLQLQNGNSGKSIVVSVSSSSISSSPLTSTISAESTCPQTTAKINNAVLNNSNSNASSSNSSRHSSNASSSSCMSMPAATVNGATFENLISVDSMTLSENNISSVTASDTLSSTTSSMLSMATEINGCLSGDNGGGIGGEIDGNHIVVPITISDNSNCNPVSNHCTHSSKNEKDGHYFLNIINMERERLIGLALKAEADMSSLLQFPENADEEVIGNLRSASGKARLLVNQKIKQFAGLCHNSLNQSADEKYPTTSEDLQGFWDMVLLQVDHIDSLFKEIEACRLNNWKKPPDTDKLLNSIGQIPKITKRPLSAKSIYGNQTKINSDRSSSTVTSTASSKSSTSIAADKRREQREQQRKQLLELKRKNKIAIEQQSGNGIDICIDNNNKATNSS